MKPINIKAKRIHRGGSWYTYARYCRASCRYDFALGSLGFLPVVRFVKGKK